MFLTISVSSGDRTFRACEPLVLLVGLPFVAADPLRRLTFVEDEHLGLVDTGQSLSSCGGAKRSLTKSHTMYPMTTQFQVFSDVFGARVA